MRWVAVLVLMTAVGIAYSYRLDSTPIRAHPPEVDLQQQAESIARSAHDADGRLLPLYFHVRESLWIQPIPVYFTALFLTGLRPSDFATRLPTILLSLIDVVLLSAIARRLFGRDRPAAVAAGLLLLTPAFFVYSRLALSSSYPVPFVLAWLLLLVVWIQERREKALWAATLCLGLGFYSDPTAVLTMPLYAAVAIATVWTQARSGRLCAIAAAGFLVPLLVLVPWFGWLPVTFRYTLDRWGLHGVAHPLDGLRYSVLNWHTLGRRSGLYWGFFNPVYLFLNVNERAGIAQSGVFLSLTLIFLVWGLRQAIVLGFERPTWYVVLLGFLLAPVSAAAFDEPHTIDRALCLLPFGALIAAAGVESLLTAPHVAIRAAAIAMLCLLPMQFSRFSMDYFAQEQARATSAFGTEGNGVRPAAFASPRRANE